MFRDRVQAGRRLAHELENYADREDVVVIALPRGGVPVGFEVARALHAPLDVFVVQKLGVPGHEELAMGAIASGGVRILNDDVVRAFKIGEDTISATIAKEQGELESRERAYRGARTAMNLQEQTVILVDDGLATGASMRAVVDAVREHQPERIVIAVPTAAPEACEELDGEVDEIVCPATPSPFMGVGAWYERFPQTSDDEVRELLERANR